MTPLRLLPLERIITRQTRRSFNFWKTAKPASAKEDPDPAGTFFKSKKPPLKEDGDSCKLKLGHNCPKVIIIGAGMAGLSAACHLHCRGVTDITILESTDRHGGRILSSWLGSGTVDFGPSSIQGASLANPVFTLANAGRVLSPEDMQDRNKVKKTLFLTRDGRTISEYKLEEMIFNHIINQAKKISKSPQQQIKANLMQFISLRIQQELLQFPAALRYDSERILYGLANSLKATFGANLSQISATAVANSVTLPGGDVRVSNGFSSVLASLLTNIPENKILYNKTVTDVAVCLKQYPGSRAIVKTSDSEEYESDFVICTLPVGVLRDKAESIFGGYLSDDLTKAISKIGVGYINKVYFQYGSPWWSPGSGGMKLAWSGDELTFRRDWTKGIGEIYEIPESKSVLGMTIGGEESLLLERSSEMEIAVEFTKFLRKFTGDSSIPYPQNVVMTRWGTSPESMGSTVYMSTDTTVGHFMTMGGYGKCLEKGMPPALLFSGDGTIPDHFGTVVGARKSGIRDADRILKYAAQMSKSCNTTDKTTDDKDPSAFSQPKKAAAY